MAVQTGFVGIETAQVEGAGGKRRAFELHANDRE
jgi:hypothetical protein